MAFSMLRPPLLALFLLLPSTNPAAAAGCFSSIFSFGDSLTDTGNYLISCGGKPDPVGHYPYGETYFHHPSGRCSDGRLVIDFIAQAMELPFVRPYLAGNCPEDFRCGANFAIAGGTALDNEFFRSKGLEISWTNYSLGTQLEWFKQLLPSLCSSDSECEDLMSNSFFLVGEIGGNDYSYGFLQGQSVEEIKKDFVPDVINAISSAVNELIELGAKTLVVPGQVPLGCLPMSLDHFQSERGEDYEPETGCLKFLNQFCAYSNRLLLDELNRLRRSHPHATIIYVDYYNAILSIFRSPQRFGFNKHNLIACCGGGGPYNYNASAVCGDERAATTVCSDPSSYVSWDGIHSTEAAYKNIAGLLLGPFTDPSLSQICPQINWNFSELHTSF